MALQKGRFADPYNAEDFIEKVSYQHLVGGSSDAFDPTPLVEAFESSINDLYELNAEVAREILDLEKVVTRKEHVVSDNIEVLGSLTEEATQALGELSAGTKGVTHKIVHIGDTLENKHLQRTRATDTRTVMEHFSAFQLSNGPLLPPFVGSDPDLHACAEIIQKLDFIASQLPGKQFADPTAKIAAKLQDIESRLIAKFKKAMHEGNIEQMKAYARTLFSFENYGECVDEFISQFISQRPRSIGNTDNDVKLIMDWIEEKCESAKATIEKVFKYPHAVSITFIQTIVKQEMGKFVGEYVFAVDGEYLDRLHRMYEQTQQMLDRLSKKLQVSDPGGLLKGNLLRQVFEDYLIGYIATEEKNLTQCYTEAVEEVFEGFSGTRHGSNSASNSPLRPKKGKKDKLLGSTVAGGRAGLYSAAELLAGGQLLRQDVALSMIYENQRALKRCETLVTPAALPDLANKIFQTLLAGLGVQYMKVSLEIAIDAITSKPDQKKSVDLNVQFLNVVSDANSIVYLLMKHFWDRVLPLVQPSINVYQECVKRKTSIMGELEVLLSNGLNQSLGAVVAYCAAFLSKQQRKTDFAPSDDSMEFASATCTEACAKVCGIISKHASGIKNCLNGKNEENVLVDLSKRVYTMLIDHLKTVQTNEMGAMLLIRDLNEYEQCIKSFESKEADEIFACLKEASAVLIVPAEQIGQLGDESRMSRVSQKLQHVFAKLRPDYKTADLGRFFLESK